MADMKKANPGFKAGNPGGALKKPLDRDVAMMRREGFVTLIKLFDKYGKVTLEELKVLSEDEATTSKMEAREAVMLKFWIKLLENGDDKRMKIMMAIYGIPTEIKSISIHEVNALYDNQNPTAKDLEVIPIRMSRKDKLKMLDKLRDHLNSSKEEDD